MQLIGVDTNSKTRVWVVGDGEGQLGLCFALAPHARTLGLQIDNQKIWNL